MYHSFFIKLVSVFVCLLFIQDEPVISWSEDYKLTWQDFNARPENIGSAVATTASGITFGFSIKESNGKVVDFTTNVKAHFYPNHSWYKKDYATNHVLVHEQLHFDITELHARKFRQRIKSLPRSNDIKQKLKNLHKTIEKELAEMQNLYDSQTNFSREKENQLKWQLHIESELQKLSNFKESNYP